MDDKTGKSYYGKDLEAMMFARNYHRWIFDAFSPYLGDAVAEVGAGIGNFSRLILDSNVKRFIAFEPSENMYPLLIERFSDEDRIEAVHDVLDARSEELENALDCIFYIDVLEHIEDDRKELAVARKTLRPGGWLLVFVPALPWLFSDFDKKIGHHRRYRKKDLFLLAIQSGFEPVHLKFFDFFGIFPWYFFYVLLKKTITSDSVRLYDRLIVPVMRKIETTLSPPVGKNLLLAARKLPR
jgi:SAM-dependent methyltransferase